MSRTLPVFLAVLALALTGGASQAATRASDGSAAWATVNSCAPGAVGMRVGVSGDGRRREVFARFTAQWWSPAAKGWDPVAGTASSPWVHVGSTVYESRQNGYTFAFAPTAPGSHPVVRGLATIEWRERGRVVRQRTLVTQAGAPDVAGGTSRASCSLG